MGHIAAAYSACESAAYMYKNQLIRDPQDVEGEVLDMKVGLYELARLSGIGTQELEERGLLNDDVRKELAERRRHWPR